MGGGSPKSEDRDSERLQSMCDPSKHKDETKWVRDRRGAHMREKRERGERASAVNTIMGVSACRAKKVISSASGMERGEVFYGPTDWLGSRDPMTHLLDWMTDAPY
jgi:hypothetical protein